MRFLSIIKKDCYIIFLIMAILNITIYYYGIDIISFIIEPLLNMNIYKNDQIVNTYIDNNVMVIGNAL